MHSLRPCLTVFVIVFALCIGATQSESAGQDIQVNCSVSDPQKMSFTFIFNTTGKNENLEFLGIQNRSKFKLKIKDFVYQKEVNALMFGLKGKTFTYLVKLDKAQLLENFKLNENVVCTHKKIVKKKIVKKTFAEDELNFQKGLTAYNKEDDATALKIWRPLAEKGYAKAQYYLGIMYNYGQGVLKDYKEAVKWYRKAANQGNAGAQYNLGHMYKKGLGVLKDYKEAAKWFRKAARQGDTDSQYNLGVLNLDGKLGNTNKLIKAYMWFNIASMNDSVISSKKRDEVEKKLTFSQIQRANRLAREWLRKHKK